MAADNVGLVRLGLTDGVIGLFDPCIFSRAAGTRAIGNFNGGMIQSQGPGNAVGIPWAWLSQAGAEYEQREGRLSIAAVLRRRSRRSVRAEHGQWIRQQHHRERANHHALRPGGPELHWHDDGPGRNTLV